VVLLALLVAAPAAAEEPGEEVENAPGGFLTTTPATAPAPAPPPTSKPAAAAAADGAGEIADPEDDDNDDWPDDTPVAASVDTVSPTVAKKAAGLRPDSGPKLITWWARGTVRLGLDTHHTGPRTGALPGVREDVMALVSDAAVGLKLRLRTEPGETYTLFNGDLHRTDFEALPGDTYVELTTKHVDLQLGMVSTVWGAADLVNPNDRLTASDMRLGPLTAERLPVLAVKADLYLGPLTLTTVWQPVFTPHRIDLFGGDFALLGPGAPSSLRMVGDLADRLANDSVESQWQGALIQSSSPRPFADSSVGVRLSGTLGGWDLALQYTYGFERLPVVRLHGDLVQHLLPYLLQPPALSTEQVLRGLARSFAEAPTVESVYLRQHQVGLSASGVLWRLVVDADVALLSRRSEHLADDGPGLPGLPLQRHGSDWTTSIDTPVLAYTLGARYTRGEELLIKLEWWHELLLDPLAQHPADRRELLLGGPQRGGAALMARYTIPRIDLTAQLLLHSELFHGSIIAAPELSYRFGDHLTAFVGAAIYAGRRGPGALFNQNDEIHLGLRGYL